MLRDEDRIFKNLYNDLGWEIGFAVQRGDWLRTKANSIEGGTSEVQLNVISKRVLGLPDK